MSWHSCLSRWYLGTRVVGAGFFGPDWRIRVLTMHLYVLYLSNFGLKYSSYPPYFYQIPQHHPNLNLALMLTCANCYKSSRLWDNYFKIVNRVLVSKICLVKFLVIDWLLKMFLGANLKKETLDVSYSVVINERSPIRSIFVLPWSIRIQVPEPTTPYSPPKR